MTVTVDYEENHSEHRKQQAPLSHVSVELGHLYAEDFERGEEHLVDHFRTVKPWLDAVVNQHRARLNNRPLRISTCFLIDDYFTPFGDPPSVLAMLLSASERSGIQLDYIARESGCAVAENVRMAELMLQRLTPEPSPNTTGARPPVWDTGWLANGQRSAGSDQAMSYVPWTPARENARNRHSIFVDVELWDQPGTSRRWACSYLAAVWQLIRLGVLRDENGEAAVRPYQIDEVPEAWEQLPAVVQVNPGARPFSAYQTFSILNQRYLPVEVATRVILGQVSVDDDIVLQIMERARREGITLDKATVGRIQYAFVN